MEVTPQDVLIRAHDLLGEYGICRGAYALDGNGNATNVDDPNRQSYCSVGGIARAIKDLTGSNNELLFNQSITALLMTGIPGTCVSEWNDALATDQEILSTFRKAAGLPEPSVPVEELAEAPEQVLVAA